MLFKELSRLGLQYIAQLHEESKPYVEKVLNSNKRFAERLREATDLANKLSKKK